MLASAAIRDIPLVLLLPVIGFTQQAPAKPLAIPPSQKTLFVNCQANEKPKKVLSPVSLSEDGTWRAYVEVDVRSDLGCAHTTRLWVARANAPYRLVYLMSPERTAVENGMEILGWARNSRMILVRTEEWQFASDALDTPRVLAINAETGMDTRPGWKPCSRRVGIRTAHFVSWMRDSAPTGMSTSWFERSSSILKMGPD